MDDTLVRKARRGCNPGLPLTSGCTPTCAGRAYAPDGSWSSVGNAACLRSLDLLERQPDAQRCQQRGLRSEEHTSELQSLMRISYAVFCLKKKKKLHTDRTTRPRHLSTKRT